MNENYPEQDSPEYEQMMRQHYGDNYELGFRVGFGKRLGAFVLDFIFLAIISFVIMIMTGVFDELMSMVEKISHDGTFDLSFMQNIEEDYPALKTTVLWSTVTGLLYWSLEGLTGSSPAKHILGLMVASENRTKASPQQLWSRFVYKNLNIIFSLLYLFSATSAFEILSSLLGFVFFVGCFLVLSVKRQGFHDMLSKTAVFHKDVIDQ